MANLNEIAPTSQNGVAVSEQTARAAKKRVSLKLWSIVTKARNKFSAQISKTCETKLACIETLLTNHPDVENFWAEYMQQVNRLLDSRRFENDCSRLGLNPEVAATHIVFLGNKNVNKALFNGVETVVTNKLHSFTKPFLPQVANKFSISHVKRLPAPEVPE